MTILMVDPLSLLIDASVAAGTLALAALTVYQLRVLMREREENQARELADKIYTPLRKEVRTWVETDVFPLYAWKELGEKEPYLMRRVNGDIVALYDKIEPIIQRVDGLNLSMNELVSKASLQARGELDLGAGTSGSGFVSFRILSGNIPIHLGIYIKNLWLSGRNLADFAANYVKEKFPGVEWELELQIDGQNKGGMKEAVELADKVLKLLAENPSAVEMREKVGEMRELGAKALKRIDEEIAKASAKMEAKSRTRQQREVYRLFRLGIVLYVAFFLYFGLSAGNLTGDQQATMTNTLATISGVLLGLYFMTEEKLHLAVTLGLLASILFSLASSMVSYDTTSFNFLTRRILFLGAVVLFAGSTYYFATHVKFRKRFD